MASALRSSAGKERLPLLDVLTSPVPSGEFNSPVDGRHVLCLHLGEPVPVSYRVGNRERLSTTTQTRRSRPVRPA